MNLSAWSPLASFRANTSNDHLSTFCSGKQNRNDVTVTFKKKGGELGEIYDAVTVNELTFWSESKHGCTVWCFCTFLFLCFCVCALYVCVCVLIPWAQIWQKGGSWVQPYWTFFGTSCMNEINTSNEVHCWVQTLRVNTAAEEHNLKFSPPGFTSSAGQKQTFKSLNTTQQDTCLKGWVRK